MSNSAYSRDYKKSTTPEISMTCAGTLALLVVTGSLTLIVALTRLGGLKSSAAAGVEEPVHGYDYMRKLDARPVEQPSSRIRMESPVRMEAAVAAAPVAVASTSGFFIEINDLGSSMRDSQSGRLLEKKGMDGVCVSPFAGDLSSRRCKVISSPVSGKSGEKVTVEDCSKSQPQSLASFPFIANESPCADVEAKTLGIVDLLSQSSPPPVIDAVLLNANGRELDILKSFPFHEYCSRSWTVLHNYDKDSMFGIRHLLEIAQGCRVREGAGEYFARCPCDKKGSAVAATGIVSKERK